MLANCKQMLEYNGGTLAIHSRFNKLITALRTAVENGEGYLDKDATSHDDLFDSFLDYLCNSGIDISVYFTFFVLSAVIDYLDPLRSPFGWFERICIVMRFMCDLTISELHYAHHIDWTPVIGNNQFNYPEISFSTNSQDFKSNFSGIICPVYES